MCMRVSSRVLFLVLRSSVLLFGAGQAMAAQYCERTNYSAQDITDAVRSSPLRDDLKGTSCSLGGLGRFESGGNKGNYNGSCCTGIFQLNNANVQKYAGTDRAGYGCMSLQNQVDAWAKLTNDGYNSPAVRQLASMSTFDGQKVDASFIAACIQLGAGNCQKMLNSGKCSGFADINGTTICRMANNARAMANPNCQDGQAVCGPSGPGDFPTSTGIAANPPPANSASIVVSPTDV
ncbi:MAG: hypothetical protein CFE29_28600 [Bradyrhizobiaceae bacterium PARB1]|jgi:hypothetical protein|uniref:Transglycosylase SLT domain-containing protein n=1 Tax=Candidatus Afipia apatlaquensis TaxID=2712852 RepID=A0A7C9VQZ8_9BRAD|nr:hypothetical protein [Candidatus Afipia apatlaquensis]OYU86401.1 MAG: hypothetical protein CFE29_28600 [Bradyrhizobiaceae bacterium PARB1]